MKAQDLIEVFQAGKEVANPEFWKQKTINANVIMVLISGVIGILNFFDCSFCSIQLTPEQMIGITTGIVSIAGLFNAGSTMATSAKVGFKKKVDASLSDDISKLQ